MSKRTLALSVAAVVLTACGGNAEKRDAARRRATLPPRPRHRRTLRMPPASSSRSACARSGCHVRAPSIEASTNGPAFWPTREGPGVC